MCVGQGFQRRKCLGGDDEECLSRVKVTCRFHELVAIDIGNEAHRQVAVAIVSQGVVCHGGAEVGSTNADVDDSAHALACVSRPCATANPVGEIRHFVQHCVDLGYDILTINDDGLTSWS